MSKLKTDSKIFGLGLSRTGTTSLGKALDALGITTIHYPYDERTHFELTGGNYKLSILRHYQAVVDISIVPFYAQLDRAYPGSKFILTVREQAPWLRSVERHWLEMKEWMGRDAQFNRFTQFICACVYGCLEFNEERFLYVYETHFRNVCDYFANRPEDLLILDICANEGWEKLCPFLGLSLPDTSFPHLNSVKDVSLEVDRFYQFDTSIKELASLINPSDSIILVHQNHVGEAIAPGCRVTPFLEKDGLYWGPPPDDDTAISELERLRRNGAKFIVFAWPAFWWVDHYEGLYKHLCVNFMRVLKNDRLMVFDMRSKPQS